MLKTANKTLTAKRPLQANSKTSALRKRTKVFIVTTLTGRNKATHNQTQHKPPLKEDLMLSIKPHIGNNTKA
jgi:hypothetical protein